MTDERKEIVEVLLTDRQYIYSLLHKVFGREPDGEMMEILTSDNTAQAFEILSDEAGDVMSKIPKFLGTIKNDLIEPDFMDKLKWEYTRLFIGPMNLIAPPWESVYNGEDAMLFQSCTLRVREFYRAYGLLPEGYPHVADDSLALELAFMTELSSRACAAFAEDNMAELKKNLEGAALFLKMHLLTWIPKFLKKMAESETDYMYPQFCLITDEFIKKDAEIIKLVLEEIKS